MKRGCAVDLHPLRETIDLRLRENVFPSAMEKWVKEQSPSKPLSRHIIARHRKDHLGLKPFNVQKREEKEQAAAAAQPTGPKPSELLDRPITDEDIEQRLKKRFYDAIDSIPPEKVAELMIEREKAKNRAPARPATPPAGSGPVEDVPDAIREMRDAASRALGGKPSRTLSRPKLRVAR